MKGPGNRCGVPRGLVSLPLIGGGVTLIGAPSAVAEPVTHRLLREYHDWLMFERDCLVGETESGNPTRYGPSCALGSAYRWHRSHRELRPKARGG